MKNTIKVLGIIALAAVIGFSMAACKNGTTPTPGGGGDTALNGTWKSGSTTIKLNNGAIEVTTSHDNFKGTYVAVGGTITIIITYWQDEGEPWVLVTDIPGYDAADYTTSVTYIVEGNTLIISGELSGTYIKQ